MTKRYALDTNLFLRFPNILEMLDEYELSVPSMILRELEKFENLKYRYGNELAFAAREIRRGLKSAKDKVYIDLKDYIWDVNEDYSSDYMDNCILKYCLSTGDGLITYDGLLYEKAIELGIDVVDIEANMEVPDDKYTGYKEVFMTQEQLDEFYNGVTKNTYGLLVNEYLIVKDKYSEEVLDAFRWDGSYYLSTISKNFKTDMFGQFKPKDIYQKCALDSLANNKIIMIKGKPGTGKSVIGINYAIHQLEKDKIDKIIFFVNPTLAKNAQALGFYTGDKDDKLLQSSVGNMLSSKFGSKSQVEAMIQREQIVLLPFGDIRGFDTTGMNALVYVIEAQNLDKELLKLGIQRLGEDSKMIIDGDFTAQVDSKAYEGRNNGMRRTSEVFRGEDYYGEVELPIIYRSEMAKRAELM
ncbi:PhoH family protein [Bacillus sp. AG4(2022)]|uniref:PhoH family protein n=1 Tax=Bacillus sp. AG4(2022) TaxID=2962594 RepID=UPI002881C59A|nr:PhoH family protein [Bacillus sp. AG4(2022)]MDT0160289.1 PhoH family protein [Bacillus sp. AG4(2022)]